MCWKNLNVVILLLLFLVVVRSNPYRHIQTWDASIASVTEAYQIIVVRARRDWCHRSSKCTQHFSSQLNLIKRNVKLLGSIWFDPATSAMSICICIYLFQQQQNNIKIELSYLLPGKKLKYCKMSTSVFRLIQQRKYSPNSLLSYPPNHLTQKSFINITQLWN